MRTPESRGSFSGLNATVSGPRITLAEQAFAIPIPEQNRVQLNLPSASRYEQSSDPDQYHFSEYEDIDQVLEFETTTPAAGSSPFEQMSTPELRPPLGKAISRFWPAWSSTNDSHFQ